MKKITLLPLFLTLLCTLAADPGKCAGINPDHPVKVYFCSSEIAMSRHEMLIRGEADTIPESELAKIKSEDIASVSILKDIILVRLKNGDSVIAKKDEPVRERKRNASSDYNEIFTKLEEEATYPGGPNEWMRYLIRTFRYPVDAQKRGIQGTVVVQFIVDKKGRVSDVQSISGPTKGGLRKEAERVIKGSGRWNPGKQNGHEVSSYKKQQITFKVE